MDNPIQHTIDDIRQVLNIHENHLYPGDLYALQCAIEHLLILKKQGFK